LALAFELALMKDYVVTQWTHYVRVKLSLGAS
jgi:hypothetical protein